MVKYRKCGTPGIHTGVFTFQYKCIKNVLSTKAAEFAAYADDNTPYFCD